MKRSKHLYTFHFCTTRINVVFLFIWYLSSQKYKKIITHSISWLDYSYVNLCTICSNWRFLLLFPIHQTGLCQLFIESQSNFFSLVTKTFSVKRVCSGRDDFHFPDRCLPLIPLYKMLGHSLSTTRPSQRWIFSRFPRSLLICQPTLWSRKFYEFKSQSSQKVFITYKNEFKAF